MNPAGFTKTSYQLITHIMDIISKNDRMHGVTAVLSGVDVIWTFVKYISLEVSRS